MSRIPSIAITMPVERPQIPTCRLVTEMPAKGQETFRPRAVDRKETQAAIRVVSHYSVTPKRIVLGASLIVVGCGSFSRSTETDIGCGQTVSAGLYVYLTLCDDGGADADGDAGSAPSPPDATLTIVPPEAGPPRTYGGAGGCPEWYTCPSSGIPSKTQQ